jgi:hypothetical protein
MIIVSPKCKLVRAWLKKAAISQPGLALGHDLPPALPPITPRMPRFRLASPGAHTLSEIQFPTRFLVV